MSATLRMSWMQVRILSWGPFFLSERLMPLSSVGRASLSESEGLRCEAASGGHYRPDDRMDRPPSGIFALSHFRTENRLPPPPARGRAFSCKCSERTHAGSNPVESSGRIAQRIEHTDPDREVEGLTPSAITTSESW